MSDPFAERIYGVPWLALAAAAALVAIVYAVLPAAIDSTGFRWLVLRWFHTIAWAFFALAALARSKVAGTPIEFAAPLAATGGLVYVVLMLTTLAGEGSPPAS
jgi:peptidoglycan/LPS O-acetylase OafA/YrhL